MPARMSGELIERAAQPARSGHDRPVRVAQHDARAHGDQLVDEEHPRLEHLLEHQDHAVALRRGDDRDRHQVGREGRPRLVLELRHMAAEIVAGSSASARRARRDRRRRSRRRRRAARSPSGSSADARRRRARCAAASASPRQARSASRPRYDPARSNSWRRRAWPARARPSCWCRCPRCRAPSATRKCARSCTCGSEAALRRSVVPSAATAAISAFSVAVTLGSSRKTSAPLRRFAAEFAAGRWR